jgi:hypothetical protein
VPPGFKFRGDVNILSNNLIFVTLVIGSFAAFRGKHIAFDQDQWRNFVAGYTPALDNPDVRHDLPA